MAGYHALPLELLAEEFAKLPGIGLKSAQRLAYSIIWNFVLSVQMKNGITA